MVVVCLRDAIQEVSNLAAIAQDAEARTVDRPAQLAAVTRDAIASPADPWLLAGVLIEGAAQTIRTLVPPEKRGECITAAPLMPMLMRRAAG